MGWGLREAESLRLAIRQLRVPGFSGTQVKPYRRPVPKAQHQARTAVIRKETAAASEASEKAQVLLSQA